MKGDALALAAVSAKIQTAGAAVAAIDAANGQLDIAAAAVSLIPAGYAAKDPVAAGLSFVLGSTQDEQAQLRDMIAQARSELAGYRANYNGYAGDDLAQEISTAHSMGIASALAYTNKVLNTCIDEIGDGPGVSAIDLVGAVSMVVQKAIEAAGKAADSIIQSAANATASVVSSLWVPIVVAGGALVLVWAYQQGILRKVVA